MGIAAGRCGRNYRLVIQRTIPLVRLVCWLSGKKECRCLPYPCLICSTKIRNTDEYKKMIRSVFQSMKLSLPENYKSSDEEKKKQINKL